MSEYTALYDATTTCTVKVGGKPLPKEESADLVRVVVDTDLAAPAMFAIELNNWGAAGAPFPWSDRGSSFVPGKKVAISLGYLGESKAVDVIQGEITSIEPVFRNEPSTMVVRGYDLRHRLLRGRKTVSFANAKDSAIATQIARAAGVPVDVESSEVTHEYVLQRNQTDLAFLQDRAERIGFEVFMASGTLQFRPRPIAERATVKLALGADLVELSPRMTMANLSAEVRVQGWDAVAKQAIVGKAGGGKELGKMSGTTAGPKAAQSAFGKTSLTVVDAPVSSVAEADQMAAGLYNTMALQYVVGDGECHGRPDLEAGMLIEVSGVGEQFGGTYYLTSVEHRWHVAGGYRTFISYQRNST